MADGSLNFDTKIDETGFDKGLKSLEDAMKRLDNSVKELKKSFTQAFTGIDTSKVASETATAESAIDGLSETTDKAAQSADNATLSFEKIMEQMQNVPIQHWEQAEDSIDNVDLSAQNLQEELNQTKASMDNVSASLENIGNDSNNIDEATQSTSAFNNMIVLIKQSLSDAGIILTSIGRKISTAFNNTESVDKSNIKIKNLVDRIDILQDNLRSLEAKGLYFGDGNYDSTYQKLVSANKELNDYKKSLSSVDSEQKKVSSSAKKSSNDIGKVSKSCKSATKSTGGLMRSLRLLKMSLMFSIAFKAFGAVTDGIKTGIQNLAQYSGDFNKSMSALKSSLTQFKNAIGTAFVPLITVAVPYLVTFINHLTNAITTFGRFIAALTGQKTFIKAKEVQEDYAKSLDKSAKSAKNAIYSFDKLETVQQKENTGNADISDMFEEVSIDSKILSAVQKLREALKPLIERAKELKDIFVGGFFDGLGDYEPRLENINESLKSIGKSISEIFSDPSVTGAFNKMLDSWSYALGQIVGSIASVGITIAQNLTGGIAMWLDSDKERIKNYLVNLFDINSEIATMVGNMWSSIAYAFEAFGGENGQRVTAALLGIVTEAFMSISELSLKLTRDLINIITQPFIDNKESIKSALDGLLGVIADVLETLKDSVVETFAVFNTVYDEHIKPFFDSVADGMSKLVAVFLEVFQTYLLPALQVFAEKFEKVFKEHIQPMLNDFMKLIGKVFDLLKAFWENILSPLLEFLIRTFGPSISFLLETVGSAVLDAIGVIADAIKGLIKVLGGIIDFLTGVFTGDWELAWQGICDVFSGVGEVLTAIANGIIGVIETMVNAVIKGVNICIDALNSLDFSIPSWVPGIGGKSFGLNLPQMPEAKLPRLATGTVVPPTSGEFAAILGDNNRETEVVSPLSTIEKALENVMSRNMNMNSNTPIQISLELDGKVLARAQLPYLNKESYRAGTSIVQGSLI